MKSKFILFVLLVVFLKSDLITEYKNQNYSNICNIANINKYKKNEQMLSIIGISCVKSDKLYILPYILNKLKHSVIGRKNSIYFLTVYMQKKLLYTFVFDNFSLNGFNLPDTDYILSHIFVKIKQNQYEKIENTYVIKYKNEVIKMYPQTDKLIVEEYIDNKLIKRRWFR